jgi:hypothetical protein
MRGACLLSRLSEDVSILFQERVFILKAYWITGSIKKCQRMFAEQFGGKQESRIPLHE